MFATIKGVRKLRDEFSLTKKGKVLVPGQAEGPVISTDVPLSFWGGFDPTCGEIMDRHHPLTGYNISGKILILPTGRGSCTASGILLEAIYAGNAPSAILLAQADEIISLGSIVGDEFLNKSIPVVVLEEKDFEDALKAKYAFIDKDGMVNLEGVF
jgi:predicted aconitase with swiveling domain